MEGSQHSLSSLLTYLEQRCNMESKIGYFSEMTEVAVLWITMKYHSMHFFLRNYYAPNWLANDEKKHGMLLL